MSLRVRINVTEQHIRDGQLRDCNYCPVALAVAEAFDCPPGDAHAGPTVLGPGRWLGKPKHRFPSPPEVREFIHRFDRGSAVHPFAFVVVVTPNG